MALNMYLFFFLIEVSSRSPFQMVPTFIIEEGHVVPTQLNQPRCYGQLSFCLHEDAPASLIDEIGVEEIVYYESGKIGAHPHELFPKNFGYEREILNMLRNRFAPILFTREGITHE